MNCLERGIPVGIRAAAIACCLSFGLAAQAEPASNKPAAAAAAKPGALAAPMPDKTKDDPVKVDAARAFILAFHPLLAPAAVAAKLDQVMPDMIAREKDNNPKLDVKKFEQDTRKRITAKQAGLLEMQAHISSRHFTLQELKDLQAFFAGPVGKKLVVETPLITREMIQQQRMFLPASTSGVNFVPVKSK
jgi:hypothetical protein